MKYALQNIEAWIYLGVPEIERKNKQKIIINLQWEFDAHKSSTTDEINDTIDYFQIQQFLVRFEEGKSWNLLEKLHTDLLSSLTHKFPELENISLSITKFPFDSGQITVT